MSWRLARSLEVLRDQINATGPGRSKASDGTIGDAAHQGTTSDHNPRVIPGVGSTPVVTALDLTHDPVHGADMDAISDALCASRDRRIKYVIFNRLIMSGVDGPSPWVWRDYTGSNPHTKHMHVSVVGTSLCDNTSAWQIGVDMALSNDDITRIVRAVWTTDNIVPAPWPVRTAANPSWAPGTTLHNGLGHAIQSNAKLDRVLAALTQLGAQVEQVPEDVITGLAGRPTEEIVAALTAALGPERAREVGAALVAA